MSFRPSYSLSGEDIVRKLEVIANIDGGLRILRLNPAWSGLLENKAKINEAVGSIGVEGTIVSIEQARAITRGEKNVKIGAKEKREFVGYIKTLDAIKKMVSDKLNLRALLTLHEMITRGDENAMPGKIKPNQNYIEYDAEIVFTPPPPEQMSFLLKEFIEWFNSTADDKNTSPVMAAAVCHFWFVWIHPFRDGNGRMARILTTYLLLKKKSEGVNYFALSDYYNRHVKEYGAALRKTNICNPALPAMNFKGALTPWLDFFIDSYYNQMLGIKVVTDQIFQFNIRVEDLRSRGLITESQDKVLSFLYKSEKASYEELAEHLDVSPQRIEQVLKPLRNAHILAEKRIGLKKWFYLGSPEFDTDESSLKKRKKVIKTKKNINYIKTKAIQGVLPIFRD